MNNQNNNKFSGFDWERLKFQLSMSFQLIRDKYAILPIISTLSVALLIILTLDENLLEITPFVKFLFIMLLFLIPISLWIHFVNTSKGAKDSLKIIGEITETDIEKEVRKLRKEKGKLSKIVDDIIGIGAYILISIITFCIFSIIILFDSVLGISVLILILSIFWVVICAINMAEKDNDVKK